MEQGVSTYDITASLDSDGQPATTQVANVTNISSTSTVVGAPGATGATGPAGSPGPSNSLGIGTVVTGSTAEAVITGTPPSQVLSLMLPSGIPATIPVSGIVKQTVFNPRDYGAVGNVEVTQDGTMSAGSTALTSASNPFAPGDVGKAISVNNALPRSSSAYGNITSGLAALTLSTVSKGNWNATTNSPSLADGTGTLGWYYTTTVAGTINLGSGSQTFAVGDYVIYNGATWQKQVGTQDIGFEPCDIGKPINVVGAGAAGGNLLTTILYYISATSVTLATNASTTVTSAAVSYGGTGLSATIAAYVSAGHVTLSAAPTWAVSGEVSWGTDDTAAIQEAINAAAVSGGIVRFTQGMYLLNSTPLTPASNVTIEGSGKAATTLKVGAGLSGLAMLYNQVSSGSTFEKFILRDLTIDGAALSPTIRGLLLDTSASISTLYNDIFVSNVDYQNCYIGQYHGANNANASGLDDCFTTRDCTFTNCSFGHMNSGTYGHTITDCWYVSNLCVGLCTRSGTFMTNVFGATPGVGPDTIMKVSNIHVENQTIVDFVNGTDNGVIINASQSSINHLYISGASQIPFSFEDAEPISSSLSDIRLRYSGGGLVLNTPNNDVTHGGVVTGLIIWRCAQKTNWTNGFSQRKSYIFILAGTWQIGQGQIDVLATSGDVIPSFGITVGSTNNALGTITFSNISMPTWGTAAYTVSGTQNNLVLSFVSCSGIPNNINASSIIATAIAATNTQTTNLLATNLLLPDASIAAYSINSAGTNGNNVSIANSASLQMVHNMTFSAWILATTTQSGANIILIRGSSSSNTNYISMDNNNLINFGIHDSIGWSHPNSSAITSGVWHHVAMTYATGVAQIGYVDGVQVANVSMVGRDTLSGPTTPLYIGSLYDGTTAFGGNIDDVRIWNVALSASQIANLYYNVIPRSGLVGEWLFSEGSGTTANDTSGNSNTGTINGTITYSSTVSSNTTSYPEVPVSEGGTGLTAVTAYALLAGGTSSTAKLQQISGVGSSGQVLTSNGSSALPTWNSPASGITRVISSISSNTAAGATANTDYVYFVTGTTTLTLPTAIGNTNRYSVTNLGSNTVTVATTSSQTINGSTTITIPGGMSVDLISNGSAWGIF